MGKNLSDPEAIAETAEKRRTAISLGWGAQSFGLAAMVALRELPPVDVAIHADTGHERSATYDFAARWTPWLEEHGVPVVTVRAEDTDTQTVNRWGGVFVPAYTDNGKGGGRLRRQCTDRWKIGPIRRWIREQGGNWEQWIGITLDEARRIRPSDVSYVVNRYPFCSLTGPVSKPMRRVDVVRWLQAHNLEIPPRSACVFCPYQSRHEWRYLQEHAPQDWQKAVEFDQQIRNLRPGPDSECPWPLFLHYSLRPLGEINFAVQPELDLWEQDCSGMCGV